MADKPNGIILYRGPSKLDGSPIVAILTGLQSASTNRKTGDMLQTWILPANVSPMDAVRTGQDAAICGDCIHRGVAGKGRTCYVTLMHGPAAVYRAYQRGVYPKATAKHFTAIQGRPIRFGSYGDPVAVPVDTWANLLRFTKQWTGYTHQWRNCHPAYQYLCMASVESESEYREAKAQGWRTFRVRRADAPLLASECICPASDEGGHKTTCADCVLCQGSARKAKDIVIMAHGTGKRLFQLEVVK